ncbi:hypothetical protein [Pelotalea chapellei]|uniref:Lipoprotein n=1 Tax=Pelotalea chapellei TaxID=44671 RepID=A0ABS5U8M6_9BACT|nr:hypothetical protein [Pelotalea chapellei]MBT1072037.1 hypothetical protein [Pelotalea chapellei]
MSNWLVLYFCLLCVMLAGCEPVQKVFDAAEAPRTRANSPATLKISGTIDSLVTLQTLDVVYTTHNSFCDRTLSWIEGASAPRVERLVYPLKKTNGTYELNLELNKFEPGFCKWAVASVNYNVTLNSSKSVPKKAAIVWFKDTGKDSLPPFDLKCLPPEKFKDILACMHPRGEYYINTRAPELRVNFDGQGTSLNDGRQLGE